MHRFLNAIWWWCVQRVKHEELDEWRMMMEAPLPTQPTPKAKRQAPWSEEQEAEDFMAMMATARK